MQTHYKSPIEAFIKRFGNFANFENLKHSFYPVSHIISEECAMRCHLTLTDNRHMISMESKEGGFIFQR